MSKYHQIKTQFRDAKTLRDALAFVCARRGIAFEQGDALTLYGYLGRPREETAEFVIRRRYVGQAANDLGFARQPDGTFALVISEHDQRHEGARLAQEIRQRYAHVQVVKLAEARGLQVSEIPTMTGDGVLRLRLTRQPQSVATPRTYV